MIYYAVIEMNKGEFCPSETPPMKGQEEPCLGHEVALCPGQGV